MISWWSAVFSFLLLANQLSGMQVLAFVVSGSRSTPTTSQLPAKRKGRSSVQKTSAPGGFGGAAKEDCACGSQQPYDQCCGVLHRDPAAYAAASADQVVRARYTAYAKRVVDFILASTHPEHPSFQQDLAHWRETISSQGYDEFELNQCEILETKHQDTEATVRFLAHMTQRDTGEQTAFIELSTFQRDPETGAWLYRDGVIQVDGQDETEEEQPQ